MTRPLNNDPKQGLQSWDADLRDDLRQLYRTPYPVPNGQFLLQDGTTEGIAYTSVGALPSAGQHDGCIAAVEISNVWYLYFSNGTSWQRVVSRVGSIVDTLTDNSTGTSGGNTIGAVTDVASAADAIATLAAKLNAVIAELQLS